MADVVLLYARDCPNVGEARSNLLRAFTAAEIAPAWREVDLAADGTPAAWRAFGSPTVLIDGEDVAGATPAAGACCRLYDDATRAPSVDAIAARLRSGARTRPRG